MSMPADIDALTPEQKREMLANLLRERAAKPNNYPMSAGQQGLWHAFRRDPNSTAFNVFLPTRIRSALNLQALRQAIEWIAARHNCLHTVFTDRDGQLTQEVRDGLKPGFEYFEINGASEQAARSIVSKDTLRAFDLENGPLFRISVYQRTEQDWIILAATHHIVVDFWSLVIVLSELRELYPSLDQSRPPTLPPAQNNYARFVHAQQQLLEGPQAAKLRSFWLNVVSQSASVIELPIDRIRPTVFRNSARNSVLSFRPETVALVAQLAARSKTTSFAVVQAAVQVFISRYCGQKNFLIGSPFSGRSHSEFESTIGFFINMLPLKADLEGDPTFSQLVTRTQRTILEALEHEAYPISKIVHDAQIPRDSARSPLFQVSCTFEKSHVRAELGRAAFLFPDTLQSQDFAGMRQESFYIPHPTCHYDLEFIFEQTEHQLRGMLVACSHLFENDTLEAMSTNFGDLLHSLLSYSETPISQVAWSTSSAAVLPYNRDASCSSQQAEATVSSMIEKAAHEHPDNIALQFGDRGISYAELLQYSENLARNWLSQRSQLGAGTSSAHSTHATATPHLPTPQPPDRTPHCTSKTPMVPIFSQNGALAFIAMFGLHRAGAAVVPIDRTQPSVEASRCCSDAGAAMYLCESPLQSGDATDDSQLAPCVGLDLHDLMHTKPAALQPELSAVPPALPIDVAYLVYTSGSTGKPKGVLIEHAAVCNTLAWRRETVPLLSDDRVLMLLSHQFDAGLGIGWTTLTQGATLVWADEEAKLDPLCLIEQIIRDRITVLPAVPSLLRVIVAHPRFKDCRSLRLIFTGGEAMSADLPSLVRRATQAKFWNFYGPSEAAIEAVAADVTNHPAERTVPIGSPINNTQILILDEHRRIVPDTVPGELAIAGAGLARGYLNDSALTTQKFIWLDASEQHGSQRVYLTGDRGRRLPNGQFEFLGRSDHQIKLRGYRIELGEIEAVLESHPGVNRAAVKLLEANTSQAKLVAFVNLNLQKNTATTGAMLLRYAAELLPNYKLPSNIVFVDPMPLTSSGKVDRKRLPESLPAGNVPEQYVAPDNALEEFIAQAWCEALKIDKVSTNTNFFDAGGSSLQAAMLTTKLSQELGIHVPTALLFDLADVAKMASRLVQLHPTAIAEKFGSAVVEHQHVLILQQSGEPPTPASHELLALLKTTGSRPPIFLIHPPGGIVVCYRELARYVDEDQPLIAVRARGLHGHEKLPESLSTMAADYIAALKTYQPTGPYTLGGWSLGGLVAYEMAQQLSAAGTEVKQLLLLDTTIPEGSTSLVPIEELVNVGLEYGIEMTLDQLGELAPAEQLPFLWEHAKGLGVIDDQSPPEVVAQVLDDLQSLFHHHIQLACIYPIERFEGKIALFRPSEIPFDLNVSPDRGWRHLAREVSVCFVPGHHHSMVQPPHVQHLAQAITRALSNA